LTYDSVLLCQSLTSGASVEPTKQIQWPAFAAPFALLVKTTLSADLPTAEPTNITALEAEVGKYVMYVCGADADLQHDNHWHKQ